MESDYEFLQNIFKKFCPAKYDGNGQKRSKRPLFKGWLDVTEEQSAELAQHVDYREGPFMFLTGKTTEYIAVDLDKKDARRKDHVNKIDGMQYWEEHYCEPDHMNTLIIKTPSGGRHLVYKYQDGIKSGQLEKDVLIDILSDGKAIFYGKGYEIQNRVMPSDAPRKFVRQTTIYNTQVNIGSINVNSDTFPSDKSVNEVLGWEFTWNMSKETANSYRLVPDTDMCCVDGVTRHSHAGHSCVFVNRSCVVLSCFNTTHGKKVLEGDVSQRLRVLFFGPNDKGVTELVDTLLALASEEQLARENGMVLKRISKNVPVYESMSKYKTFLTARLANNAQLKAFPQHFKYLLLYMDNVDDDAFPFVKRDRKYIGFSNGMLNIVSGELEDYDCLNIGVSPRHYINQVCQFDDLGTPLFDSIFCYQLDCGDESDAVYTYLLGLIGRLFYNVGEFDRFDVMPLIVGDTSTGKSTLIDIVSAMFAPDRVGVVDSSHEAVFGLQSMYEKELVVSSEIPDNMARMLASDKFKKMVCGEKIEVPIKHSVAETVTWRVPMIMCGNDYPRYRNEKGAISKRLAIFSFTRYVDIQDSSLKDRIIDKELSRLVVKCLVAYRHLLHHNGTTSFWMQCPSYFRDTTAGMHETTDYVHMFLTIGQGDNMWFDKAVNARKIMYFVQIPGHTMWMEDFKKKFYDYLRFRHPLVKHRWSKDYSTFKRLGYSVERRNVCRACKEPATRNCCEASSQANRSHIDIITNIQCVETYLPVDNDY